MDNTSATSNDIRHTLRALYHRNYRLYFGGQSITLIGAAARSFAAAILLGSASAAFSQDHKAMEMRSDLFPNALMQRAGSGTSWLPDAAPMHAYHIQIGPWNLMAHGSLVLRYTNQDVAREGRNSSRAVDAPNWFMLMAATPVGSAGRFIGRAMLSLDRLTEGGNGYPLLFQTGESWKGEPLVDRQHPHDLFSELALAYSHQGGENLSLFVYLGLPGEPALGPPVFMHRPSALNNPDATLGHHWQDASHISFGVATAGLQYKDFKLDGSTFTGREPNEDRYNIDKPRFDSYSVRLSFNPSHRIALQTSTGFLKSPEALEPDTDVWRTTASLLHVYPINTEKNVSTAIIWGMNKPTSQEAEQSFVVESDFAMGGQSIYARLEFVEKTAAELGLENFQERLFSARSITVGYVKEFLSIWDLSASIGVQGTAYAIQNDLKPFYGSNPFSLELFLKLRPPSLILGHHAMNHKEMIHR